MITTILTKADFYQWQFENQHLSEEEKYKEIKECIPIGYTPEMFGLCKKPRQGVLIKVD